MSMLTIIWVLLATAICCDIFGITEVPLRLVGTCIILILIAIPELVYFVNRLRHRKKFKNKYFMDWLSEKWGF